MRLFDRVRDAVGESGELGRAARHHERSRHSRLLLHHGAVCRQQVRPLHTEDRQKLPDIRVRFYFFYLFETWNTKQPTVPIDCLMPMPLAFTGIAGLFKNVQLFLTVSVRLSFAFSHSRYCGDNH